MAHTKYSHLTDDELLRMVDNAHPKSPMIEELATRLERTKAEESGTWTQDCPVCKAALNCTLNDVGDKLILEVA